MVAKKFPNNAFYAVSNDGVANFPTNSQSKPRACRWVVSNPDLYKETIMTKSFPLILHCHKVMIRTHSLTGPESHRL